MRQRNDTDLPGISANGPHGESRARGGPPPPRRRWLLPLSMLLLALLAIGIELTTVDLSGVLQIASNISHEQASHLSYGQVAIRSLLLVVVVGLILNLTFNRRRAKRMGARDAELAEMKAKSIADIKQTVAPSPSLPRRAVSKNVSSPPTPADLWNVLQSPALQTSKAIRVSKHITIGQQLGNYRIIKLVGQGGFADVYLGQHVYLKTQAAIKVLNTHLTSKAAATEFLKEARTIANLTHPNIIRVLDFGIEGEEPEDLEKSTLIIKGGLPFLIMDYAPGGTLRQRHPEGTRLPLATIISYVEQIARALAYAHQQKLIHCDIKPGNMLVGAHNEILLSDFGIAVIAHSEDSMTPQKGTGTVPYMAPEQFSGKPQLASDQYALAIVVYEWLCGSYPFQGSTPLQIMYQHIATPPPPLRNTLPTIPVAVEQVVLKALSKDPKQRFANITAFANALSQAARHT